MKYLDKYCLFSVCGKQLKASRHKGKTEAARRDKAMRCCHGGCASGYQRELRVAALDKKFCECGAEIGWINRNGGTIPPADWINKKTCGSNECLKRAIADGRDEGLTKLAAYYVQPDAVESFYLRWPMR